MPATQSKLPASVCAVTKNYGNLTGITNKNWILFAAILQIIIYLVIFSPGSIAQNLAGRPGFMESMNSAVIKKNDNSYPCKTCIIYRNQISTKAMRNFKKTYGEEVKEMWSLIPGGGFLTTFEVDGLTNYVYYSRSGQWSYTIRNYDEEKLLPEIRSLAKSTYYEYTFTLISEIECPLGLFYIIHMENKTTIKNVAIAINGEMRELESFRKQ